MNGLTLGFIAWREHHRALWFWAGAWLAWAVAVLPLLVLGTHPSAPLSAVACGALWVVSALCFLRGTYAFAGRRMPRVWLGVAAVCAALGLALGLGPAGAKGMIPLVLFQSVGLLATGVLILRSSRRGAGTWLCGIALITLALHLLDAPILSEQPHWMRWGFVVATALEVLAALGMLALYYEQARFELLGAQRILAENRRIETLGRVAGGVAHDLNNLLTVLQGNLELLRRNERLGGTALECLDSMDQALSQTGRLTAQLLSFGSRSVAQPGAIPDRGTVSVLLERLEVPEPRAVLRVVDDGSGMDKDVIDQAFEPFFTTKAAGQGTGLGLATVQRAVRELGGQIRVESSPGKGSTFEVVLPLATGKAATLPGPNASASGELGSSSGLEGPAQRALANPFARKAR
jgi:signal transduction histidine kinase